MLNQDKPPTYQSPGPSDGYPFTNSTHSQADSTESVTKLKKARSPVNNGSTAPQDDLSDTSSNKRDGPGKQMGRGLLMVLVTPLAIAGMGIYAVGMMLEGGAMMFKGAGAIGRMPLEKVRTNLKGKKKRPSGSN